MMNNLVGIKEGQMVASETAAQDLILLMEEFMAVVAEENAMLARGLPASLSSAVVRKTELAAAFELWVQAVNARAVRLETVPAPLRKQFFERLSQFQDAMNENVARLEAAIEASRRRIEAVMSAIREEMTELSPYGANGKSRAVSTRNATRPGISI